MVMNEEPSFTNRDELEEWVSRFFLNPLTTYLDEQQFRIDLYETSENIIIEALLTGFRKENLSVYIKEHQVDIKVKTDTEKVKSRQINLPFCVDQHIVNAIFTDGILELFIHKDIGGPMKARFVPIP